MRPILMPERRAILRRLRPAAEVWRDDHDRLFIRASAELTTPHERNGASYRPLPTRREKEFCYE